VTLRCRWFAPGVLAMVIGALPAPSEAAGNSAHFHWIAQWIAAQPDTPLASHDAQLLPIFRHSFTVDKKIAEATLSISGLGQFEAHINGHNVTDAVLTPAWSGYRKRIFL
jgi:hypothetical protein